MLALIFPNFGWDWLAWLALVPLQMVVARAPRVRDAFWPGYLAGAIFFGVSCYWIAGTVHRFGGNSPAVSAVVFVLFLALMGVYLAIYAGVGAWLGRWCGQRYLPLPFVWVGVEWLRTYTPMGGFPWNLLGYSQVDHAGFMLVTPFAGIYGAGFLIVLANTLLAALLARFIDAGREPRRAPRALPTTLDAIGLGLVLAFATLPYHRPATPPGGLIVRMVQPDTPLDHAWTPTEFQSFLARQTALSLGQPVAGAVERTGAANPNLILWPEQPAPLFWELDPRLRAVTAQVEALTHASMLFEEVAFARGPNGAPDENRPYNSALLVEPDGTTERYDKMHLVPFGEYVPLPGWVQRVGGIGKIVAQAGDFIPGRRPIIFHIAGGSFGALICYESIFPNQVRDEVRQGAEWLVNLSDDGWYGSSSAAAQDETMARARAIENRRWLLRDTNDGFTTTIDPYGRVTAQLPRWQLGVLDAHFAAVTDTTFYTRHGDWFLWVCAVMMGLCVGFGWGGRRRRSHAS